MQTIKDAGLLILVIVLLGSVRIQTTNEISIDFPATEAAQTFQQDTRPPLEHPALVKPQNAPTGPRGATQAAPGNAHSPECKTPDVKCDPEGRTTGSDDVEPDCIA
jgi:hypothetical protein